METIVEPSVITADNAVEFLKEGNKRFINNLRLNRNFLDEIEMTREGQSPFAVIVSCMDSRTAPEIIFDRGIGDVFSIRIAGNVITPEVIGSVEYACAAVGSKAVIVLGHTGCGAIKGTLDNVKFGHLPTITSRIRECITHNASIEESTIQNVKAGIKKLENESKVLNELIIKKEIKIIGGIYDIETGQVTFVEQ